ncbi:hypothetical protein GOBAR_AA40410 [Gossypium barbadense]|uniref:Uncharacterized protein n=1 Tax=Gossypium barbadense TaxID=3634 RepID=A0A2P5VN85_GOSBA|nr:hypothetical protein GOBAR_AA40410 [Gossypium barbadense]
MALGIEIAEMGWDLSLRAQSMRAQAMNSVWLREEGGVLGGINIGGNSQGNSGWGIDKRIGCAKDIDPVLGFNLEGKMSSLRQGKKILLSGQIQTAMDHDMDDEVVTGEEGKIELQGRLKKAIMW